MAAGAEGILSRIIVLKRRPVAQIEAKSMTHRSVYPNLIYQWIITFEFAGDYGAFGVAGDSGVLDNDCINLVLYYFLQTKSFNSMSRISLYNTVYIGELWMPFRDRFH